MGHDIDNIPTFDPELMGSFQLTSFQCGQLSVDICVQADQDGPYIGEVLIYLIS